ncbi:MAG: aldehyde dehydrogenase family protein [Acidobacteria bacterium]|nr:aldehyde dehydrogenase family protein [Acidobacteriota bacterium]
MTDKPLLIGGEWRATDNLKEVRAPYTGELLARVSYAAQAEVEEAIAAAASAAAQMRALPRYELAESLRRIADYIKERREEFARAIALESAKPITGARGEVDRGVSTFTFASEEARRFTGETVPVDTQALGRGRFAWTERAPRGIIFGITPFNFPLNLVAHKVAPALASRNSIIIKPSPRTPLTALLLGEAFLSSGLPKGALQVVPMDIPLLDIMFDDERVAMISFTGSATVGWKMRARVPYKQVTLELGGNAPVIVDETANIKYSVERSLMAAFAYAGQVCISAQRLFIHQKIADEWTQTFVERAKSLPTGDPLDEATVLSVMIDEEAARRAEEWIGEALNGGARLLCGGTRKGSLLDATVLADVHEEMRVSSEEVFAPVATIETFADFTEALAAANHTRYGLQAGVFTRDVNRIYEAAQTLEFGGVMINDAPAFRVDNMPYGGVKLSGAGREGVRYAMEEMTEQRVIVVDPTK